jgi:hypothetical protein
VADAFNRHKKIVEWCKAKVALAEFASGNHLGLKIVLVAEEQVLADADFAAWADEALPFIRFFVELASEQDFDMSLHEAARGRIVGAKGLRFDSASAAIEAGRENTSVVEDDEIVRAKKLRKVAELAVFKPSGRSRQVKKPGGRTVWKGLLRDQFIGKIVIEIGDQHRRLIIRMQPNWRAFPRI